MEELNAVRAELGINARLAADTTSENEENYPHYPASGAKQKRKKRSTVNFQGLSVRGLQLEDETIRPVFSTLQRMEFVPSKSLLVRELSEDSYRAMLIAHKKRRARRDVRIYFTILLHTAVFLNKAHNFSFLFFICIFFLMRSQISLIIIYFSLLYLLYLYLNRTKLFFFFAGSSRTKYPRNCTF